MEDILMHVKVLIFMLFLLPHAAYSEESVNNAQGKENSSGGDTRQLVSMPEQSRELMRKDMLDHLSAVNEIIAYMASNNLDAAADVADP